MANIDTGKIRKNLKLIENFFLDILFPKNCIGCGKEGKYICEKCSTFLGEALLICPVCGKGSFSGQKHIYCPSRNKLDGLISVWEYEGLAKAIIHNIKYRKLGDAVLEFTELSFKTMAKDKERFASFFSCLYSQKPLITFVPMFFRKKKKRRFNQSELTAEKVSKITGLEWISLLGKTKENKSQTELNKEERTNNVKGVFL